jgi:hypothetical protein
VHVRTIWIILASQAAVFAQTSKPPAPPEQPIPFSHKVHAGTMKIQCQMCHANPAPGELMRIAASLVCMQCHSTIKPDSPAIRKLAKAVKTGQEIPWVRVYEIPSYVGFSHKPHLEAGTACESCHGLAASRDRLFREGDVSMGGCVECHQAKKVSIDCNFCHGPV